MVRFSYLSSVNWDTKAGSLVLRILKFQLWCVDRLRVFGFPLETYQRMVEVKLIIQWFTPIHIHECLFMICLIQHFLWNLNGYLIAYAPNYLSLNYIKQLRVRLRATRYKRDWLAQMTFPTISTLVSLDY